MLRTNLATRPFYNERLVRIALGVGALVVTLLTVFNVWELATLSRRDAALRGRVEQAEADASRFRRDAAQARASVDREQLEAVLAASREANALIGQRVFSWTRLLNQLEETLPANVRILTIKPTSDEAGLGIDMLVLARQPEDIDEFVNKLEATGAFSGVFTRQETVQDDGLLEVVLGGRYGGGDKAGSQGPSAPSEPPTRDLRGD
jgi:Tfp pilus assembly protein PilN